MKIGEGSKTWIVLKDLPLIGDIRINEVVVKGWIIIAVVALLCIFLTRGLRTKNPKKKQIIAEKLIITLDNLVSGTMGEQAISYAPYIGAVFVYSAFGSACELLGTYPVTGDLNTTVGMALATVFLVFFNHIRSKGVLGWLKTFIKPYVFMLPINLASEIAMPVSLAFRHFGNIVGGTIIMGLFSNMLKSLSLMIPFNTLHIPFLEIGLPAALALYFDVFSVAIQAFIFCMLTMVFVSQAMEKE